VGKLRRQPRDLAPTSRDGGAKLGGVRSRTDKGDEKKEMEGQKGERKKENIEKKENVKKRKKKKDKYINGYKESFCLIYNSI
jgi:hypothetical protein